MAVTTPNVSKEPEKWPLFFCDISEVVKAAKIADALLIAKMQVRVPKNQFAGTNPTWAWNLSGKERTRTRAVKCTLFRPIAIYCAVQKVLRTMCNWPQSKGNSVRFTSVATLGSSYGK